MLVRHIIFAGLFVAASFANAGTVEASSAAVQPAWSLNAGLSAAAAPVGASASLLAGPGSWNAHTRRGDRASQSTMLFSQAGAAPVRLSTVSASDAVHATPAPDVAAVVFAAPAQVAAEVVIAAPAPGELAAIVVSADVIAAAPAALAAIPEPATGMLMLAGLLGAGFMSRRRK